MPEIVRLSVDLPTPLEPSTATISPAPTSRSMPRSTSVSPYPARRPRTVEQRSLGMRGSEFRRRAVTEIGLDDFCIGGDLRRRAFGDDAALGQHEDMLRQLITACMTCSIINDG